MLSFVCCSNNYSNNNEIKKKIKCERFFSFGDKSIISEAKSTAHDRCLVDAVSATMQTGV